KIFGGYLQVATLKSSCIGLFAHSLKIHPIEFLEIPIKNALPGFSGPRKGGCRHTDGSFHRRTGRRAAGPFPADGVDGRTVQASS
ncbi:MAG: hypothetical protein IKQ82_02280, partial [Lentisphaeria bacterium]|nr:hypothetical protein [Lentisphaeria bacterium]